MSIYLLSVLVFLGAFCGSLAAHYVVRWSERNRGLVRTDYLPEIRSRFYDKSNPIKGNVFAPGEVKWMSKGR